MSDPATEKEVVAPAAESENQLVAQDGALQAKRQKRVVEFEKLYVDALPDQEMYERSYMHRDTVTHVFMTPRTNFLVTCSIDGQLKFWKKLPKDIIFVKHFRPHMTPFAGVCVSQDGQFVCSTSEDRSVKVFDVANFDLINMIKLDFTPGPLELFQPTDTHRWKLVVCSKLHPEMYIYDPLVSVTAATANTAAQNVDGEQRETRRVIKVNTAPVHLIRYNAPMRTLVSCSQDGVIEYWSPDTLQFDPEAVNFKFRTQTDLFEFAKQKTLPLSLDFNKEGTIFASWCKDRKVRIFRFLTGKLYRIYDESLSLYHQLQKDENSPYHLEPIDFVHRVALEKEVDDAMAKGLCPASNIVFDDSGHFILFGTMLGVKILNITTNRVARILGTVEGSERFLAVTMFQGMIREDQAIFQLQQQAQAPLSGEDTPDPTVFCTAYKRQRFYLFTRREPEEGDGENALAGRDVFNEKPTKEELAALPASKSALGSTAILRTSMGDVYFKLFAQEAPKAVENFVTHSRSGYYNNLIFHRVIKGFMIQTGDPQGDGCGGQSIWGDEFEDEFHHSLRFDQPFTVAMANCGPNTNGSQFFITCVATPWLDGKHTIFGRITKGMDVVQAIERVKTMRDRPEKDIRIINIEIL